MLNNQYIEKIEIIVEEIMKTYKTQCFFNLPARVKRAQFVTIQTTIIMSVLQSMFRYLKNSSHPPINISEVVKEVCESVIYHFQNE